MLVHSVDPTTHFLQAIPDFLGGRLHRPWDHITLTQPGAEEAARQKIQQAAPGTTIIFLGHGASYCIYGPPAKEGVRGSPLLDDQHFSLLQGKNFVSLSCRSSEFISRNFKEKGGSAMLGFDDLPTHWADVEAEREVNWKAYPKIDGEVLERYRTLLVKVFKMALADALSQFMNFEQFYTRLRYYINKELNTLCAQIATPQILLLENMLFDLKKGILLKGERQIEL
jgi:hypothetical protein